MSKHSNLLWITGLFLGWAFDLLFWKQPLGINFGLYSILCVSGACLVLLVNRQSPSRGSLLVFPLILIFSAITAIRTEPMTVFLAACLTLLLMLVLANTYLGGLWLRYGFGDYIAAGLNLIGSAIARPVRFSAEVRKKEQEAGVGRKRASIWPYLRGVLIAIPIVAIFSALLASADAAFSTQLDALLKLLAIENLPQYIFRMVYILVGAYVLVGVILHASTQSKDEKLAGGQKPLVSSFLGFTEAAIVLGSVAILFAAFVIIQFRYFFGGQANITVAGFTYSEYARRGFGELVAVAFFSLLMILGLEAITRREGTPQRWAFSGLSAAIVVLVLVMLVSAYQRLVLYETAYGFSRLRTYTHVALVWIGLLLVAVVVLEIFQHQRFHVPAMLITVMGFALSLALLNVDGLIVRQNVGRAIAGSPFADDVMRGRVHGALDVQYLASLSSDSVPALAELYESASTPAATKDIVGALLFCHWESNGQGAPPGWQSFTLSRGQADAAIRRLAPQLSAYRLIEADWPTTIQTPAGAIYQCQGAGVD